MTKAAPFVVDMDSHVMEPPDLWDNYLERKYRDRSISIRVNKDGLEELVVDNRYCLPVAWLRWVALITTHRNSL